MANRRIVVPTDFSPASLVALRQAEHLAVATNGELLIVHVYEPVVAYSDMGIGVMAIQPDLDALRAELERIRPENPNLAFEHQLLEGNPADEIVRCAEREAADMIVIATHGRTGLRRMLMGSVAEAVVRRAKCPVLSVKPAESLVESLPVA